MCTATSRRKVRYIPQSSPKSFIYYFYCCYPKEVTLSLLHVIFLGGFTRRCSTCFKAVFLGTCIEDSSLNTVGCLTSSTCIEDTSLITVGCLTSSTVSQPFVALGAHEGLRYVLGSETPVRVLFKHPDINITNT